MACRQCQGIERFFDEATARRELERYRRKGPAKTTRLLLEALEAEGVEGRTFLDVGGGVGAIQHELLAGGAASGTHADASPAYLEAARSEARRRGNLERMRFVLGDAVELAAVSGERPPDEGDTRAAARHDGTSDDTAAPGHLPPSADFVTLDRVVCCYPDMEGLVDATAARAERAYGLVFPRVNLLTRVGFRLLNLVQRLRNHPFHVFLHPTEGVVERVRRHGLEPRVHHRTFLWQVMVFVR